MRRASSSIDTPCIAARIRNRDSVSSSSFLTLKLATTGSARLSPMRYSKYGDPHRIGKRMILVPELIMKQETTLSNE